MEFYRSPKSRLWGVRFKILHFAKKKGEFLMNVNSQKKSIYKITVCAVMIALGTVLSMYKVWEMPLGGSITPLSMLPNVFISVMYGIPWGLVAALISSFIQLFLSLGEVLSWGLTPASLVGTLALDYVLAYTVIGFAGIWRKNGYLGLCIGKALVKILHRQINLEKIWHKDGCMGVCIGTAFAVILRFICHYISGVIIFDIWCPWANVWVYSLCYNGAYMLPELVLTVIGTVLLFRSKQIKRFVAAG